MTIALVKAGRPADPAAIENSFEIPREERFGDLASNIAMKLKSEKQDNPRRIATEVVSHLNLSSPDLKNRIKAVKIEGAGFINFHFTDEEISRVVEEILTNKETFGKPSSTHKENILLEFVSANPTGPLTVAHGRQAALGDSLARILRFAGHRVTTEYYNNDEGVQIDTLGRSMRLWLRRKWGETVEFPETFYRGAYLEAVADGLLAERGAALKKTPSDKLDEICSNYAKEKILEEIRGDLAAFDVRFDGYYSQAALARSGRVETALEELAKRGHVFEGEGATWLRTTPFGDDKDRVLVKSDGSYTYLSPDIAYHHEKFERGFDELINIWGPDHHGYIPRLKASQAALGHDPARVRILIAQLVTLYEGAKQVRMSTRAGEFVTLRQILDEVGKDAGRFFFVMRKFDAHLDFDLALAKSLTPENPVFYIQYAHARIESIKKTAADAGARHAVPLRDAPFDANLLRAPEEMRLMRLLWQYEDHVRGAVLTLEPFRLVPYLMDLAATFHRFYTECRVVTEDADLSRARLALAAATQAVIRSGLNLLGVSAPLKM